MFHFHLFNLIIIVLNLHSQVIQIILIQLINFIHLILKQAIQIILIIDLTILKVPKLSLHIYFFHLLFP